MVYFIKESEGAAPAVKIGYSNSHSAGRLSALSTGNPRGLELAASLEVCGQRTEQLLHRHFSQEHIRGEWFRHSKRMQRFLEWVDEHPQANKTAVEATLRIRDGAKRAAERSRPQGVATRKRRSRKKRERIAKIQAEADSGALTLRNITRLAGRASVCPECSEDIDAGDLIAKSNGRWVHDACS